MLLVTCLVTLYCMCTGSYCQQDKFLVSASILGNKALSDSDSDSELVLRSLYELFEASKW